MRIVLIGPTYPFRGGIAHYTTLLCKTLRQDHDVKFISFRRQYPRVFFPGKSERDTSDIPVEVGDVDYIIDSLNPLTWLTAVRQIKEFEPEKLVFPWWVAFWAPQFWAILTLIKRYLACEVVFICHNVVEHESNLLKVIATRIVLSKGDRLITHSKAETRKIKELLGEDVNAVTAFHPTYSGLSDRRYTKERAKEMLGLKGDVLLFFGFVRDYKGLGFLLDAMPLVFREREATLLVVGEFWKDKRKYLEQIDRCGICARVMIIDKYIPNEEIALYFGAADLVVQPYITASGSGVCQIAFGFDRPVVATTVGDLRDVVEDGINGKLVAPGDPEKLAAAILASLDPNTLLRFSRNAAKTKEKFCWNRMAQIVSGVAPGPGAGFEFLAGRP